MTDTSPELSINHIERLAVLGSLAGGIAHQVNDALTAVRLTLGRLISFELSRQPPTPEDEHRIELLQDIREGVDRIERIARELRGFAQAEMSVCRDTVLAMGGQITAESEVGKGTIMRVTLPVVADLSVDAAFEAEATEPRPIRVLIVDDDRPVGAAVALALADHEVVVASSGREAIEILRHDPAFDVVLCDLMMPELSGIEVFHWVKPVEPRLAERFVFMTGGAFTPRAERFLAEVPNPCVDKPFAPEELRELVARVAAAGRQPVS